MEKSRLLVYLYLFSLTCGLSLALVPLMKRLARRFGVLDKPGPRKIHREAIPLLGGGAVFLSFTIAVLGNYLLFLWLGRSKLFLEYLPKLNGQYLLAVDLWPKLALIMLTALVIFGLGVLDDIVGVGFSFRLKFAVQFVMAEALVMNGIVIGIFPYPWLNNVGTVLWIVGISNSFNLLDNMDGLSSGVAILASVIFFVVAYQQGQFFMTLILIALLGSILGFYPYNFPHPTIFLGDGGSLVIGFLLGVLTVLESYVTNDSPTLFPIALPLLVLSVPLFDTFSVIYIRLRERRPVFVGDKRHLSHRLVALGMSKRQAVLCIYLFTLILGINSLLLGKLTSYGCLIVLAQGLLIILLISVFMQLGAGRRDNS